MSSSLELMADELAIAEVHAGFPIERLELARRLLHEGVSEADVALLSEHCRATVDGPGAAARVLASLLGSPARRDARLVDLREIAAKKAARALQEDRAFGDKPYVPGPVEGESREAWDHDRQCRMAWCCVNGDKRSPASVAREMGVSETTLGVMLERGRVLSRSPLVSERVEIPSPAAVDKAERAGEKRAVDFRERMSIDRKQRERAGGRRPFDFDRMAKEQGKILARLRSIGNVDLAEIMRDPCKRGALATLEADGHVLRAEAPDLNQCQRYHVARDEAERARFVEQRRVWDQADMNKSRPRAHAGGGQ